MKNILFLTTMYPIPGPEFSLNTPVCHYFTKEWHKMGYNVRVIHYLSIFPIFYYWAIFLFPKQAARFIGNDKNYTTRRTKDLHFMMDGISVYSFPIFKFFPHGKYLNFTISKQINKILKINKSDDFIPDFILGHFHNPQLQIISELKTIYPQARTSIVLHEKAISIKKTYTKHFRKYMGNIDVWGFRFKSLKEDFENIYGNTFKTFIAQSGIPENYINTSNKQFENKIKKFCFVGQLISLKRTCDILHALHKSFPLKDFEFNIVGEGMEKENLQHIVQSLELKYQVKFWGNQSRGDVQNIMNDSDCYIMISESEAFGLVYLEAMSKGCITIGTKGQGIDGVIINGINGFLCESKNIDELADIIQHINSLSTEELIKISQNAINTAKEMTNFMTAKKYINSVTC